MSPDDDKALEAVAMAIVEQWKIAEHNAAAFTPNAIARAAITAYLSAMPQHELLREALEALSEAAAIFDAIKRHGGTISQQVHTFASGPRTEAKEAWAFPKWMFDELDSAENDARAAADKIRASLTQEKQT